jgi:protease IV
MRRYLLVGCVAFLSVVFSLQAVQGAFSVKVSVKKKAAKSAAKGPIVVSLTLDGEYREGPGSPGIFGDLEPSLGDIVRRLDAAAADKDVSAVWLKINDLAVGRAKIFELQGAIARLRKAGKPVYAELTSAGSGEYMLASACDQIVMPPCGVVVIPGVRAEITFYKGLLDKLGLEFDVLKMGKYKGAAEPFTRKDMSPPLRESYESLVEDNYQDMLGVIATNRKLKDYQAKTYIDRGLFSAEDAKKAGLIDQVLYSDQLEDAIKQRLKSDKIDVVTDYKKNKIDTDFSGLSGMIKLIEILAGGKPSATSGKKPRIAVVYAVGPIMEGKGEKGMFSSEAVGSTSTIAALRKAADDPKVAAIVFRIDSPGGSASASDLIWRETVRIKKPIIASMGDVAGSGGYYIAMGAKKIYAAPCTLTGSIGVIGGKLVTRGLYDKIGLNKEVIARGENSGAMSSNQAFSPGERKVWLEMLEDTYRRFVSKAAEGRKMSYEKLHELAQGRVYTGMTAKKLGLVDEIGTLQDAICAAKTSAGLSADADVDLLVLPEPKTFFEQLFGDPAAASDADSLVSDGIRLLQQTKMLRKMLSERVLMWMPYEVQVK